MFNAPYTDKQKKFISQHCSQMTAAELVILFNETFHDSRTKKGLQYFMQANGLKCYRRPNTWADGFTEEQKNFMRKYGGTVSRPELTEKFNQHFCISVPYNTIRSWCARNQIPISDTALMQELKRKMLTSGNSITAVFRRIVC